MKRVDIRLGILLVPLKMKVLLVLAVCFVVATQARPETECEKHRRKVIEHETIMKLIPECDEKGNYKPLQCYKDSDFCVCYDKKGHAASPISKTLRKCDCHLQRHDKIKFGSEDSYLPQCDAVGNFKKKQCWAKNGSCWCVDENNETIGKIFADGDSLQCD